MNAVAEKKHFTVAINWAEKSLEQWLEQYGSWLLLDGNCDINLSAKSILGNLIDATNGVVVDKRHRVPPRCNISLVQAIAIEDMLCELKKTEGRKVANWIDTVILFYVDFQTEEIIAKKRGVSEYSIARDKMLGLVRISTRFKLRSRLTG